MPSIIPSYVYTLLASIIVGSLIIGVCSLVIVNVRNEAEKQQLSSIAQYVASKSVELTAYAPADNLTSTVSLNVPSLIGNQRYWVQITNDSSRAWVEVGFGANIQSSRQKVFLPLEIAASGTYISGSGTAFLKFRPNGAGDSLVLLGGN